ncbi:MAG: type II toxin-antitoxin system prevent-host-death family antitoxin [Deltaproteobacteria bacterium]|nr:type II toxin-antitoxin system prevent-host-death family antitoxin [Deltaproteobacteria bacterium]
MKLVRIADAKNNLSRHLEYVRAGGRVRILDRNTPVADLVPVDTVEGDDEDAALLRSLARRGIVRLGDASPFPNDLLRPGPSDPESRLLAALLAERRQGR